MWQVTQQNYIITQFQTNKVKGTCFNFWGLGVEINKYGKQLQYKVESLKAKRYTLQSSDPMHFNKKGSVTTITSPKHSLTGNY